MAKKTDNSNLKSKLLLRRYFLDRYHAKERPRVLDCCQGSGLIWSELRKDYDCEYWGVDQKPRKGRLQLDSARILQQPGLVQNVIDIDTYGSPWRHWLALLPNVKSAVTVFLTIGQSNIGHMAADPAGLEALGIKFPTLILPGAIGGHLWDLAVVYLLARSAEYGLKIREAMEATRGSSARYLGVRLEPAR